MLNILPSEVLANIIGRLDRHSAWNCSLLNKNINEICRSYRLNLPNADQLQIMYNKDTGKYMIACRFDLEDKDQLVESESEITQEQVIANVFGTLRNVKHLFLTNMVIEQDLVDIIRTKKENKEGLETLQLENTTCSINIDQFYDLVNSINELETDIEALVTVDRGEVTYDQFFSVILPKLHLYSDISLDDLYNLDTLTDAFLPRLFEVMPREFSIENCQSNLTVAGVEKAVNVAHVSGLYLFWQFGSVSKTGPEDQAAIRRIENNFGGLFSNALVQLQGNY